MTVAHQIPITPLPAHNRAGSFATGSDPDYVRLVSFIDHCQIFDHDSHPHTAYCFAWNSVWWVVTFTNRDGHAGESVRLKRVRYGLAEALARGVEVYLQREKGI